MDPLLFLRQSTYFQSMELEGVEAICGLESSSRSRLWSTRGDRAVRRELSVFGLGLNRKYQEMFLRDRGTRHRRSQRYALPWSVSDCFFERMLDAVDHFGDDVHGVE